MGSEHWERLCGELLTERDAWQARHAEAVAVLREVEWVKDDHRALGGSTHCSRCDRGRFQIYPNDEKHADDCRLDAALKGDDHAENNA